MEIELKVKNGYLKINTPKFETGKCRGCGKDIFWITGKNKKPMPISRLGNGDLVSHFYDCSKANQFRKKNAGNTQKPSGGSVSGRAGN